MAHLFEELEGASFVLLAMWYAWFGVGALAVVLLASVKIATPLIHLPNIVPSAATATLFFAAIGWVFAVTRFVLLMWTDKAVTGRAKAGQTIAHERIRRVVWVVKARDVDVAIQLLLTVLLWIFLRL